MSRGSRKQPQEHLKYVLVPERRKRGVSSAYYRDYGGGGLSRKGRGRTSSTLACADYAKKRYIGGEYASRKTRKSKKEVYTVRRQKSSAEWIRKGVQGGGKEHNLAISKDSIAREKRKRGTSTIGRPFKLKEEGAQKCVGSIESVRDH